jgi:hypothetical protein
MPLQRRAAQQNAQQNMSQKRTKLNDLLQVIELSMNAMLLLCLQC